MRLEPDISGAQFFCLDQSSGDAPFIAFFSLSVCSCFFVVVDSFCRKGDVVEAVLVERMEEVSEEVLEDLWRREESLEGIVVVGGDLIEG